MSTRTLQRVSTGAAATMSMASIALGVFWVFSAI
jgi:hypothetical protein